MVVVRMRRSQLAWLSLLVGLAGLVARPIGTAAVGWAPSTGLLVSEVVTGAASASDEMIELYNASSSDVDLGGLELVYASSSGATVTRKQTWTALVLPARRHLLLANSAGAWSAAADGTYTGGLSASGGSLVLRTIGGTVIDALSWGDAASSFVETRAATAPPAGTSLERKPGGPAGNGNDTNDNLADTALNPSPIAHPLAAAPVPDGTPTASPSTNPTPTPAQTPAASPTPSPSPAVICSWAPLAAPSAAPGPTATAWPFPTPLPTPSPTPSPRQTGYPAQAPTTIALARTLPSGSLATLSGQLTVATGLLDGGATTYLDDGTGGIALHLAGADWPMLAAGTFVSATGVLGERHGETTLLLGSAMDVVFLAGGTRPIPLWAATGLACEDLEARLIALQAWVTASAQPVDGGLGATVDDGTGPLNVIVPLPIVAAAESLLAGNLVEVVGVLSQLDQTTDGHAHYGLILADLSDVVVLSRPTPSPSLPPTPSPSPVRSPSPTPGPTPSPSALAIADARLLPLGTHVLVRGVVTVEPGRILGGSVVAVQDDSAGIYVRLPDGAPAVALGQNVEIGGTLAAPYGNLELRPTAAEVRPIGPGTLPAPRILAATDLGELSEGVLARLAATVDSVETGSSGSLALIVHDDGGSARVFFHATLGAAAATFRAGQQLDAVGLVGDRLGLYRLWPRDLADVAILAAPPTPSPRSTATPRPSPTPEARPSATATAGPTPTPSRTGADRISIADALRRAGTTVTVSGTVTTRPGLLDADGRRVTVQDATAAVLVRLPADFATQPGRRLTVTGQVGTYYEAPQLTAAQAQDDGADALPATAVRAAPIAPGLEWRLVTVSGPIDAVHRDGDAWRAQLMLAGGSVPIVGLARSGIAATALEAGRAATITGIVKRAYPTAADQRLTIVPRSTADIRLGQAMPTGRPAGATPGPGGPPQSSASPGHPAGGSPPVGRPSPRDGDVALADLAAHRGATARVGGAVVSVAGTLIVLADSSGSATLALVGRAAPLAAALSVGDLVNATGTVVAGPEGVRVVIDDPANVASIRSSGRATPSDASSSMGHVYRPPDGHLAAANPAQADLAPAFAVAIVAAVLTALGALAIRLGWTDRLLSRWRRI